MLTLPDVFYKLEPPYCLMHTSTHTQDSAAVLPDTAPKRLPFWFLMTLYIAVPFALVFICIDTFWLNGHYRGLLPQSPYEIYFYNVIFVLPHIIASLILQLNPEYLKVYGRRFTGAALVCVATVTGLVLFSIIMAQTAIFYNVMLDVMLIYTALTVYHVFMQQLGLNALFSRYRGLGFQILRWSALVPMITVSMDPALYANDKNQLFSMAITYSIAISICATIVASILFYRNSKTRAGKLYLLANLCLLATTFIAFHMGYPIFILLPRVVHDTTAFSIYVTHARNRAEDTAAAPNILLRPFIKRISPPLFYLSPIVAMALSFPISKNLFIYSSWVIMALTLLHYYIEHMVWRRGSPHRKYIGFSGIK